MQGTEISFMNFLAVKINNNIISHPFSGNLDIGQGSNQAQVVN